MQITKFPARQKPKKAGYRLALLIAAAVFVISGCAAQGAKRVPRDRFDYNAAIAQSTREQMLLKYCTQPIPGSAGVFDGQFCADPI